MKPGIVVLAVMASITLAATRPGVAGDPIYDCSREPERTARIEACSIAIASGALDAREMSIAHSNRGLAYWDVREFDAARSDYDTAIALNPANPTALMNRGLMYLDIGDPVQSLADFNATLALDPLRTEAIFGRGSSLLLAEGPEAAVADLELAVKMEPEVSRYRHNLALVYSRRGDDARAVAEYSEVIRRKPDFAPSYANRANVYCRTGEVALSLDDRLTAIELGYIDPDALLDMLRTTGHFMAVGAEATEASAYKALEDWTRDRCPLPPR